ncbi:MAG: AMP nucleosidase [Rhodobacteraceae bacterium]|nr:AMP nucleosidase [Paracoccaceae bacterium]
MKVIVDNRPPRQFTGPDPLEPVLCRTAEDVLDSLQAFYAHSTGFLRRQLKQVDDTASSPQSFRACYPELVLEITDYSVGDSRLSYGRVDLPGVYATTITRPKLFSSYLIEQVGLLIKHHGVPLTVRQSTTPIPIHFALDGDHADAIDLPGLQDGMHRNYFDVPDLSVMNDDIVNGIGFGNEYPTQPLALFPAPRVDYSLARLEHYTATDPGHFQSFVLFTNYQQYVDEFIDYARRAIDSPASGYNTLVLPGNQVLHHAKDPIIWPERLPQMPACHLTRADGRGISIINIGVGPSNAKTATDHIAVLRPDTWIMLGHCAGLRTTQRLGDYVLAHAYLREDQVLDSDLPTWVPIPALAEVQQGLEHAVASVTSRQGYDIKEIMRTGTVASTSNRNWELRTRSDSIMSLSQSRAIGLDMESATIAGNGFRFRVPYGTLLCVSDKPLHGELKLAGMANEFYQNQVSKHLLVGIAALENLRAMPREFLHSRKLRSFEETAFK